MPSNDTTASPQQHVGSTAELDKPIQWRALNRSDTIQRGDQGLNDDCETWHEVMPIFCGQLYNPGFFVPMRRRLSNTERSGAERPTGAES